MNEKIKNFLNYVRFELCIFSAFIGASGYLLNNPLSSKLLFVALTSFFVCAGAYSFNNRTDMIEDIINRKHKNLFASNQTGKIITFAAFALGFIFSLFLSFSSVAFYILTAGTSIAYSALRLKKYLFLKNLYTGFGVPQVFLIGAAAGPMSIQAFFYYITLSFFIIILSIISDIRDYDGDKLSGIKTVPVIWGHEKARYLVLAFLAIYGIQTLRLPELFAVLPFVGIMFLSVLGKKYSTAHIMGSFSFIFLMIWLVV